MTRPSPAATPLGAPPRPRLGLALGGGGARGFAHIGVLQVLQAHGVPIDVVAGTSMGAIIGGAYLCGLNLDKLIKLLQTLDLHRLLDVPHNPITELVERATAEYLFKKVPWRYEDTPKTRRLLEFFRLLTKRKEFDELDRPFAVVAADVNSGRPVVLHRGELARALAASVALPGLHDPVCWDGRLLVDGGIVNKVPVSVAVDLGADVVVAVDVSGQIANEVHTSLGVLAQASSITSRALMRAQLKLMDKQLGPRLVVLRPEVAGIKVLALDHVLEPVEAGRRAARQALGLVQRALDAGGGP